MTEAGTIRAKIKAREGRLGHESNLRALRQRLAEIESTPDSPDAPEPSEGQEP